MKTLSLVLTVLTPVTLAIAGPSASIDREGKIKGRGWISDPHVASDGKILFSTNGSLLVFDPTTLKLSRAQEQDISALPSYSFKSLKEATRDTLWLDHSNVVGTDGGNILSGPSDTLLLESPEGKFLAKLGLGGLLPDFTQRQIQRIYPISKNVFVVKTYASFSSGGCGGDGWVKSALFVVQVTE